MTLKLMQEDPSYGWLVFLCKKTVEGNTVKLAIEERWLSPSYNKGDEGNLINNHIKVSFDSTDFDLNDNAFDIWIDGFVRGLETTGPEVKRTYE